MFYRSNTRLQVALIESLESRRLMSAAPVATPAAQPQDAADLILECDTNHDGKVDASDYARIDNGFLNHLTGQSNGDFNLDGVINGSDYTLIDNAFNTVNAGGDFTRISFSTVASGPVARSEALKASVNGKLYVFGGFDVNNGPMLRSDVYTPATNSWKQIANLPEALTHVGVAVDGDNIWFCGGYVGIPNKGFNQIFGTKDVWIYNTDTNTFTAGPAMPAQYVGGGAVIVGRTLHYFGGFDISRADVNVHWDLNLDNPSAGWKSDTPMLKSVNHMGYVNYGGKIYAIAGQIGHDAGLTTQSGVQIFDPATDTWTAGASMPAARSHIASATFVMGDRIIVMGGESANEVQAKECYAYTPATNKWVQLTSLPTPKFSGVADVFNGIIYFTSGGNSKTTYKGTPQL